MYFFHKNQFAIKWVIILASIVFICTWVINTNQQTEINLSNLNSWWNQLLDPIIGLFTFVISLLIYFNQLYKQWYDKLPHYFDVHIHCTQSSTTEMIIFNIPVRGLQDIRNKSQSLVKSFNQNVFLDLTGIEKIINTEVRYEKIEQDAITNLTFIHSVYELCVSSPLQHNLNSSKKTLKYYQYNADITKPNTELFTTSEIDKYSNMSTQKKQNLRFEDI